ncbi:hypothetical protein ACJJTC_016006 [Scirpophaga incertulas]
MADESIADIKFFNAKPSNSTLNSATGNLPAKPVPKFKPDDLYYDMSGEKILLIFNHFEYKSTRYFRTKPTSRSGTYEDVTTLKEVFKELGFNKVITHTDLTHEEILTITRQISAWDHTRTSCLAIVILTHGDIGGQLFASDKPYYLNDIVNIIIHGDVNLVTKPKLFFVQACRGADVDDGRIVHDGEAENTIVVPSHIDFLVMQSSVEGFLSWRDRKGSWLIQELCKVLSNHHDSMDLLQMITLTNRNIAINRESNTPRDASTHRKKQTPETRYTLTKLLKF